MSKKTFFYGNRKSAEMAKKSGITQKKIHEAKVIAWAKEAFKTPVRMSTQEIADAYNLHRHTVQRMLRLLTNSHTCIVWYDYEKNPDGTAKKVQVVELDVGQTPPEYPLMDYLLGSSGQTTCNVEKMITETGLGKALIYGTIRECRKVGYVVKMKGADGVYLLVRRDANDRRNSAVPKNQVSVESDAFSWPQTGLLGFKHAQAMC